MVARIARRVAPGRDIEAALIFATMLVPLAEFTVWCGPVV